MSIDHDQHTNDGSLELLIVIVCYKVADLTIDCLESLEDEVRVNPGVKVALLDNGSEDGSFERLQQAIDDRGWAAWVRLESVSPNRGFAGGNNVLLRQVLDMPSPPRYVMLLNTDTIVRPGAIRILLDAAQANPEAGIISPRLEWPDGTPQISCFRFTNPLSELINSARTSVVTKLLRPFDVPIPVSDEPMEAQWTSFACAIIRIEVLREVGVLDEGYYLYFDDVDYCRSARRAGWTVLHWPEAHVVHLRGGANPLKEMAAKRKRRPSYWYVSRTHYFGKFYGPAGPILANAMWFTGRGISLVREMVGRKEPHICQREWRDIWTNWRRPLARNPRWAEL